MSEHGILASEINEQAEVVQRFLEREGTNVRNLAQRLNKRGFSYLLIAARGTSDNAGRYGHYLFGAYNKLPLAFAAPSLHTIYRCPPQMQGALVIGISQSGRSPDIVSVIQEARRQGRPTLAITNVPDSPLAQAAEEVLCLHAGEERAVAATKTYTASLAALALLSAEFSASKERLEELWRMPEKIQETLDLVKPHLKRVERYSYIGRSAVIARGFNYANAFEIALKIEELSKTMTTCYSSADFLHGPISMLEYRFPLIVLAPSGEALEDLRNLLVTAQSRGAELIVISDHKDILKQGALALPLPAAVPEWLSPLVSVIPGQLFAYSLTLAKGLNPDQPLGLTKITETY